MSYIPRQTENIDLTASLWKHMLYVLTDAVTWLEGRPEEQVDVYYDQLVSLSDRLSNLLKRADDV